MRQPSFLDSAQKYLSYRRSLGYAMHIEGAELCRFARYLDSLDYQGPLTTDIAVHWAQLPQHCQRLYHARRLDIIRRFARYLQQEVPATEIPPPKLLGPSYRRRPTPHIYSVEEISLLLDATRTLTPKEGLRPHTYETLFGLLAVTGMRISEALALQQVDFQAESSMLTVREGKYHNSRLLPLHPTTIQKMMAYVTHRNQRFPLPSTPAFFLTEKGTSLKYHKVLMTFLKLTDQLGWRTDSELQGPRIHDLRHTFAVQKILEWHRGGEDVNQMISRLSMYLGHVKVADTYWYLTAVPELMEIIGSRFETFVQRGVNDA